MTPYLPLPEIQRRRSRTNRRRAMRRWNRSGRTTNCRSSRLSRSLSPRLSSIVVVPETEQAVIVRTGEPVRVINKFSPDTPYGQTGAGLVLRIPFVERVQRVDKRVLRSRHGAPAGALDRPAAAQCRCLCPLSRSSTRSRWCARRARPRMSRPSSRRSFSSVVRQELGRRSFASLLTAERGTTMDEYPRRRSTRRRANTARR